MDYRIDCSKYSPRELYLMWLIHIEPKEFKRQNNLLYSNGCLYQAE